MMQAQAGWQALPGADCVSSDDESWLNHTGFRFPNDNEKDEVDSATARAYVQAVNRLKVRPMKMVCNKSKVGESQVSVTVCTEHQPVGPKLPS